MANPVYIKGYDPDMRLDIEYYPFHGDEYWAQAQYLAHGYDDVLWTDSLKDALMFLEDSMTRYVEDN